MSSQERLSKLHLLRIRRINLERTIKDVLFIGSGVASAGFGLKGFLLPNKFLDGGVMGISLLTNIITGFNLSILVILINIPFVIIAYTQVSQKFAFKTLIAITLLAMVLAWVEFPIITSDKLLIAVFGGFFLGAGIGLSIRGGSVIDGTEVLAIYSSRKTTLTVGDVILELLLEKLAVKLDGDRHGVAFQELGLEAAEPERQLSVREHPLAQIGIQDNGVHGTL